MKVYRVFFDNEKSSGEFQQNRLIVANDFNDARLQAECFAVKVHVEIDSITRVDGDVL